MTNIDYIFIYNRLNACIIQIFSFSQFTMIKLKKNNPLSCFNPAKKYLNKKLSKDQFFIYNSIFIATEFVIC